MGYNIMYIIQTFKQYLTEAVDNKIQTIVLKLIKNVFINDKNFLNAKNESANRHPNQIRIVYDTLENIEDELNEKITSTYNFIKINNTTYSGSGIYKTFEITIDTNILKNFKNRSNILTITNVQSFEDLVYMLTNFKCWLVYAINSKSRMNDDRKSYLRNKELTPANLGVEKGKLYSLVQLYSTILKKINSSPKESKIALFEKYLKQILRITCGIKINNYIFPIALELKDISQRDIDIMNKDFGEIICALSVLKQNSGSLVEFPSINEKVVDFNLFVNGNIANKIGYSVKNHGKSKGTAMSSIPDMIAFYKSTTKIMPKDFDMFEKYINLICFGTNQNKNLTPIKIFDCANAFAANNSSSILASALNELKTIFNVNDTNFDTFKTKINTIQNNDDELKIVVKKLLDNFYKNSSYNLGDSKYNTIDGIIGLIKDKKYGLIVQPIGALLTRELNKLESITNCLSAVLNCQENLVQIETSISVDKNGNLVYNIPQQRTFTKNKFKFDYNGMRNDSGSNRLIGYKMVK